jgi:hypothetical protein
MQLTPRHISILERLCAREFQIVAFPMYADYVGVRKGNCAALLAPVASGEFSVCVKPAYLIQGNFSVRMKHDADEWFVWKTVRIEATPERIGELDRFSEELTESLLPIA